MRKYRIYIGILLLFVCTIQTKGQYDPSFAHYWMMEPQYNPASAGSTNLLRIVGAYSAQMSGYEDAPKTMYAGGDLPLFFINPHHGAGFSFMNDELGFFSHKRFSVQYAYKFKLLGGTMSIGAQGEMLNESIDASKADVELSGDPVFNSSKLDGSKFDAGFGIYYKHNRWYAGASALHLTAPTILMGETNEFNVDRIYYVTSGYNIQLRNPYFAICPSVFGMYDGSEYKAIVSGRVEYNNEKKSLFGGASYSPEHSVALFVGGKFKGVVLSYSYEAYTTGVGIEHGAHEIIMSYEMELNLYKKGKNLHKSVRLL